MARPLRLEFAGALYHVTSREYDQAHADRNQVIIATYASGGYTMREIGDYFGLHHSRISKIGRRQPRQGGEAQVKT